METAEQTTVGKVLRYKLNPLASGVLAAFIGMLVFLLLQADTRAIVLVLGCGALCFATGYLTRRYSRHPSER